MEQFLAEELRGLGLSSVQEARGGVTFEGPLESAYRACLWSRIANRVLLPLKTFAAPTPEKLYGGVKSVRWSDHLSPMRTLAVDYTIAGQSRASGQSRPQGSAVGGKAPASGGGITHSHFGALKVKDAIVDQFRSTQGSRPSVNPIQPDVRVNVYVFENEATVSIDLSGDSLHRRGYRSEDTGAPLKENLAASILWCAEWPKRAIQGNEVSFLDPMCGSGTLLIEAALMALKRAPGLGRKHYGFLGWSGHDHEAWKRLLEEARDLEIKDPKKLPRIVGYDQDPRAVRVALANLERAGMLGKVHVEKREFGGCEAISPTGLLVVNPPYGERLGEAEDLRDLYKRMGDTFKQKFKGWDAYIFTGSSELSKCVGLKASRRIPLYNGAIECRLFKYELY